MAWVRKTCWRCKREKPQTDFNRDKSRWDGLRATCRECAVSESASYRVRNRARVLARERAFNAANPQNVRVKSRAFYRANTADEYARCDAYRRANLLKFREFAAKRRALARSTAVCPIDYEQIKLRDHMRCHICGLEVLGEQLHFDHIVPLSKGGPHIKENIAVSHARCNQAKGARLMGAL